ncbi:MAG: hypothetical protein OEW12_08175 [Deltaproteobacteria bacterium]|nr:hypothetical protein [Deltaproteobacteria bacterium]
MGDMVLEPLVGPPDWVVIHPGWDLEAVRVRMGSGHRTIQGHWYGCLWGVYDQVHAPLVFVSSRDQALMNNWWRTGQQVAFTLDTSAWPSTIAGRIVNKAPPLDGFQWPYPDLYQGVLQIEADGNTPRYGRPFLLDDNTLGVLDQMYNALL